MEKNVENDEYIFGINLITKPIYSFYFFVGDVKTVE